MKDYRVGQKVLHWIMAILITMDLFVAQKFGGYLEDWDRLESRADHGSLGTILALLLIWRLYYRVRYGAPPLPATMPPWQITAARAGHFLLYFVAVCLICTGVATAVNAASPLALFGTIDITTGQLDEDTFQAIRVFHEFCTNALIALIVVHVLASVYHHFVAKDDTTVRMLRFWRSG